MALPNPYINSEAIEQYKVVYKSVYPTQDLPIDPMQSFERMVRKCIKLNFILWSNFLSGSKQSITLVVDQYKVKIEKSPLRVSGVKGKKDNTQTNDPPIPEEESLDLERVRFAAPALARFARMFPQYINGDVEQSARSILAQARERDAISDHEKRRRMVTHGGSQYFRFENCRFILIPKTGGLLMVVTAEDAFLD